MYRIKGILTLQQRRELIEFIQVYQTLINNPELPELIRSMVELFNLWVIMCKLALHIDNSKILEKIIAPYRGKD